MIGPEDFIKHVSVVHEDVTPLLAKDMTLRDYLAGQALVGLLANGSATGNVRINGTEVEFDVAAYMLADGMLKERVK